MTGKNPMPIPLQFRNLRASEVWKIFLDWSEKKVQEEQTKFFDLSGEEAENQKVRAAMYGQFLNEQKSFIINSARMKEKM